MGHLIGITDEAATKDDFSIEHYKEGLRKFIETCDTPMTIAIQGDWGSGKTSMMKMVQDSLGKNVKSIWFNTWQYSQFNMDKELTISFMKDIVDELDVKDEETKTKFNKSVNKVGGFLKTGLSMFVDSKFGGTTTEVFQQILDVLTGSNSEDNNIVREIKELHKKFEECVLKALEENERKDRLVIFVDDLDRLNPGKAVELLEVLKLFLDCKKCVFVLAIDYSVVTRGVREKYGEDFDEEKGRSFFDKIIQVPFKMPVSQYDIERYVSNRLKDIGIGYSTIEDLKKMTNLIKTSIGNNPRSMKRLFNSYLLLSNVINDKEILRTEKNQQLMFAILCMQSRFETAYNYISQHQELITAEFLDHLTDIKSKEIEMLKIKERDVPAFVDYAISLAELIDQDDSSSIDEDELNAFREAFRYSTITSTGLDDEPTEDRWNVRFFHKDICIDLVERLNKKYGVRFEDHFYKGKNIGSWRINCWSPTGHTDEDGELLRIEFQMRLTPTKFDEKSSMQIVIQFTEGNLEKFWQKFGDNPFYDLKLREATFKPEKYDIGYQFDDVMIFNPYNKDERIFNVVDAAFASVLKYFK